MNATTRAPRTLPAFLVRLAALVRKELLQAVRDPAAMLIAIVLPPMLLFLFAYAVSLDVREVHVGLVLESDAPAARDLAAAYTGTRYFRVTAAHDRRELVPAMVGGQIAGIVVIPSDFPRRLANPGSAPLLQVLTDGSQPNTARFVSGYAEGVLGNWLAGRLADRRDAARAGAGRARAGSIEVAPRFWFNPELESRRFLVPGAIAIVMTMIGTLLTALVVAREWERGTMEAIMATPAGTAEVLLSKLLPYFGLGLVATLLCALMAVHVFGVPLRGSWFALIALTSAFLVPALGLGILISTVTRNQFLASQVALLAGFLPSFLLSGFLFEIQSMPAPIRALTYVLPARYFVPTLQTVFLAGDVWAEFGRSIASMLGIGAVLFAIVARRTPTRLDE